MRWIKKTLVVASPRSKTFPYNTTPHPSHDVSNRVLPFLKVDGDVQPASPSEMRLPVLYSQDGLPKSHMLHVLLCHDFWRRRFGAHQAMYQTSSKACCAASSLPPASIGEVTPFRPSSHKEAVCHYADYFRHHTFAAFAVLHNITPKIAVKVCDSKDTGD